jgi:hypothetical protein
MSTPSFAPTRLASVSRQTLIITAVVLALAVAATVLALTTSTTSPRVATNPAPAAPAAAGHVTNAGQTGTAFGGMR